MDDWEVAYKTWHQKFFGWSAKDKCSPARYAFEAAWRLRGGEDEQEPAEDWDAGEEAVDWRIAT